eukprot:898547-Pelagomonas_calceolata.AAC.1
MSLEQLGLGVNTTTVCCSRRKKKREAVCQLRLKQTPNRSPFQAPKGVRSGCSECAQVKLGVRGAWSPFKASVLNHLDACISKSEQQNVPPHKSSPPGKLSSAAPPSRQAKEQCNGHRASASNGAGSNARQQEQQQRQRQRQPPKVE